MPKKTTRKKVRSGKARKQTSRVSWGVHETEDAFYWTKEPVFVTLAEVMGFHTDQIARYGGTDGTRDMALLQSALAQPEASFGGAWLHEDLFEMAAAYAFHLCQNHPFFDGNKRTALDTALIFLELNGIPLLDPRKDLINTMLSVAAGKMSKKELARIFRTLPRD